MMGTRRRGRIPVRRGRAAPARRRMPARWRQLAGALALAGSCWPLLGAPAAADEEAGGPKSAAVTTITLASGWLRSSISAYGRVTAAPAGAVQFSVPYESVVREIRVRAGESVRRGQILFVLDESPEAKLAREQAAIADSAAARALAQTRRLHDLKLVDNGELGKAEEAARTAHAQRASLQARRAASARGLAAPADGIVTRVDVAAGVLVAAGSPLAEAALGMAREAALGVEPSAGSQLTPGDTVLVRSLDDPFAPPVLARLRSVSPAIDPATRLLDVYADLPADAPLLLEQYVSAELFGAGGSGLVVPASALLPEGDKQVVFLVRHGLAHRREVEVVRRTEEKAQIRGDSLAAGDEIVTLGNYELEDGDPVRVEKAP